MIVCEYGENALLVEVADVSQVLALHASLLAEPPVGVTEIVPAARTLLLRMADSADRSDVTANVCGRDLTETAPAGGGLVEIAVGYDGADLAEVCELTGLDTAAVIAAHTSADLRVAFVGFAPGFAYLVGLPASLRVPRRAEPRTRVPAGSVGLAGEFTGIYPRASPGGWQLIGHTEVTLWDIDREPPALLQPGDRVRFRAL